MWRKLLRISLVFLSVLATIKICILGLGIDEEYAVAMSCRIVSGDRMFLEMWEPHQTSAFLNVLLIRLFLAVTGGLDYLIIFLRVAGSLIQLGISIFLYRTVRRHFSEDASFLAAVFFYNTLPKWIQTPEFSNMMIWFSVLTFLCLLRYYFPAGNLPEGGGPSAAVPPETGRPSAAGNLPEGGGPSAAVPPETGRPSAVGNLPEGGGPSVAVPPETGRPSAAGNLSESGTPSAAEKPFRTGGRYGSRLWLVGAGVSASCLVLSYPSCILAVPLALPCLWAMQGGKGRPEKRRQFALQAGIFLGTCAVLGCLYLIFFLCQMSPADFLYGLSQMMTDGTHSASLWEKVLTYGKEAGTLLLYALAACLPAALLCLLVPRWRNLRDFGVLSLGISLLEQIFLWLGNGMFLQKPLVYFFLLYGLGVLSYWRLGAKDRAPGSVRSFLFWMGIVWGGVIWLCGLGITNTTLSATGSYLMLGLICGILLVPGRGALAALTAVCLVGTTLFAKGYLVYSNDGMKDTVAMVRQKALYGPAEGIYCRYMDGCELNCYAELLESLSLNQARVLYVGNHALCYLYGDSVICNFSTISTPTYDERLLEYWEKNPDRRPELVICGNSGEGLEEVGKLLPLGELLAQREFLADGEGIRVYRVQSSFRKGNEP